MKTYLRIGDDTIFDAKRYHSKAIAIQRFQVVAFELDRIGQKIEGSLHYARNKDELHEYPDFVLKLGPRGGVVCERT